MPSFGGEFRDSLAINKKYTTFLVVYLGCYLRVGLIEKALDRFEEALEETHDRIPDFLQEVAILFGV